ncbi:hypothetical protein D1872_267880 [compost metagenome]
MLPDASAILRIPIDISSIVFALSTDMAACLSASSDVSCTRFTTCSTALEFCSVPAVNSSLEAATWLDSSEIPSTMVRIEPTISL